MVRRSNPNKWKLITTAPNSFIGEVQTYTSSTSNVSLSGSGSLQITPRKDGNNNWTSGRLEGQFAYACPPGLRILLQAELRLGTAPFAQQAGIWPAFWALGAGFAKTGADHVDWSKCGEWDIVENAHGVDWTLASIHYGPQGGSPFDTMKGGDPNSSAKRQFNVNEFHTFALKVNRSDSDWRKEQLEWFIDGARWFIVKGADVNDFTLWENLAHKPFYSVLNVAVGSNFPAVGGKPDGNTVSGLGSGMQVKYVAFYESDYTGYPAWELGSH